MNLPRAQDSPSSLNTFEQCKRRYDYDYLHNNPRNGWTSIEAVMGSAVHTSIECFLLTGASPWETFEQSIEEQMGKGIVVSPKPERDEQWARDEGAKCIANFLVYYADNLKDKGYTFEVEKQVATQARPGWKVGGFVDCVAFDDHTVWVIDWKTGARGPYPQFIGSSVAKQLGLYAKAVAPEHPGKKVMVAAVYLSTSVFEENPEGFAAEATADSLTGVQEWLDIVSAGISREEDWEPSAGVLCGWCRWADTDKDDPFHCAEGAKRVKRMKKK